MSLTITPDVPPSRTLNIAGDAEDLSADRSWLDLPNLRVLTASFTMPANTTLVSVDSLTVNNGVNLTIPNTSATQVANDSNSRPYWNFTATVSANFSIGFMGDGAAPGLTDIPRLTYPALANSLYETEFVLIGQPSNTNGITLTVAYSAAGATGNFNCLAGGSLTTMNNVGNVIGSANLGTLWTVATTDQSAWGRALVKTGANAGNITIQVNKSTSGSVTIYAGSSMKVRKLI